MPKRDIIVIGSSAGGLQTLRQLLQKLPGDLPASLFLVQHRPPEQRNMLSEILNQLGPLTASEAEDGQKLVYGHVYIAPPDRHLILEDGRVRVLRGPKENYSRPAIDPLFRSAATSYGSRVAGVILSGTLSDGTAGLYTVKRYGGVTIVQDPEEAAFPGMPNSAIENVPIDYILPVDDIADLLRRLAAGTEGEGQLTKIEGSSEMLRPDDEFLQLTRTAPNDQRKQVDGERHGKITVFTCPDCGGTLWQADDGKLVEFRCHVGHAYSAQAMLQGQYECLEREVWTSIRTLTDISLILEQLAKKASLHGDQREAERLISESENARVRMKALREIATS